MNTEFTYRYRDAANFKVYESVVVAGILKLETLEPYLYEGDYFLPENIGLKSLVPVPPTSYDHIFHELDTAEPTDQPANFVSSDELVRRFAKQSRIGWLVEWHQRLPR